MKGNSHTNNFDNNTFRNPTDKYHNKAVAITSILFIFVMFVVSIGIIFKTDSTYSYFGAEDYTIGDIKVKGVQLKVYQNTASGYKDVTDTGFDLNTKTFATDKKYNYDLIIRNDEKATVTADQYYLRWYFTALVDNQEYDITKYTTVDSAYVYLQDDTDGKSRYYSVNGSTSNVISAQNQLAFLSSIRFDGVYDNINKKYGSILDEEFGGSPIKIIANIEGSLTPYEILVPTIKFYNPDGSIMQEITLTDDITTISVVNETPQASITVDGQTLYFQGWTKNGQNNVLYTPNQSVEVSPKDTFTPYYGIDPDYSDFTFTVDSVTGEYILAGANKNATTINIPTLNKGEKVTVIKNQGFYNYSKLETVTMPQTITKIGNLAFYGCSNLTSINIPDGVTSIDSSAFDGCTSLTSITIPDSVTSIGWSTFANCASLTSINIPDGVTSIGNYAFHGCTSLTSIDIPNGVTSIDSSAFYDCTSLTLINIPDSVASIGNYAFYGCTSLTSINIPDGVTSIDSSAFYHCTSLTLITIPASVTKIGRMCFNYCFRLTNVTFENTSGWYMTSSSSYDNGTAIDVTNSATNATNLNSNSGVWSTKYLYCV